MRAHGVVQSPVLVGRDDLTSPSPSGGSPRPRRARASCCSSRGRRASARPACSARSRGRAEASGFAVARAAAFPGDAESLGGPAAGPGRRPDVRAATGPERPRPAPDVAGCASSATGAGDAHHRRRLLVQDLADLIVTGRPGTPVLVVLEDLHWADELSLDVLGHLAGGSRTRPMLVAGAYRSDELYPQLPMRDLRARLLAQRLAEEVRLPRLTAGADRDHDQRGARPAGAGPGGRGDPRSAATASRCTSRSSSRPSTRAR